MNRKIINSLYDYYKNTPKKLKIVCDWDEVIQACEPYACWQELFGGRKMDETDKKDFAKYFKKFWENNMIEYSPYGSKIKDNF